MEKYCIKNNDIFINKEYMINYLKWLINKVNLDEKSYVLENNRQNNLHPVRPRKGEIYLIEFGKNIGTELNNIHMGIIMQNSFKNSNSSTIVVIPISSSNKIYDSHEKILDKDVIEGKLNKIPCKAKAEQIMCIDKSRLIHKIGRMSDDFIKRLEVKIKINLDIA